MVILFVNPHAVPGMTDERICLESPVFPIVVTVALLIKCQPSHSAVDIFPFTGEVMAVIGLRRHLWRKGVHGHSPVNRDLVQDAASNTQTRRSEADLSTPCHDDRP